MTEFKTPKLDRVVMLAKKLSSRLADSKEEKLVVLGDDHHQCKCGTTMEKLSEYTVGCPKCTTSVDIGNQGEYTAGSSEYNNVSANAYTSFRIVGGARHKMYMHAAVKITSDPDIVRDSKIQQTIAYYNHMNKEFKIAKDVCDAAGKTFASLKDHDSVRRGMGRRGMLGACIYVECQRAKITKTLAQIARMMNVEESQVSNGYQELQRYHAAKIIDIPQNHDPTPDYIDALFELFEIKTEYKPFINELLQLSVLHRLHGINNCNINSRCIGAIYGLNVWLKLNISHDTITKNCDNISRNTYLNVWRAIELNERVLRSVFAKYVIPLPITWL